MTSLFECLCSTYLSSYVFLMLARIVLIYVTRCVAIFNLTWQLSRIHGITVKKSTRLKFFVTCHWCPKITTIDDILEIALTAKECFILAKIKHSLTTINDSTSRSSVACDKYRSSSEVFFLICIYTIDSWPFYPVFAAVNAGASGDVKWNLEWSTAWYELLLV